ncbi:MAG TPA: hypothetical protein VFR03_20435 [Thermoanaerobaculia bacterium]|nr:hypothetical protein [Thermoanaerobaculia bacterium]
MKKIVPLLLLVVPLLLPTNASAQLQYFGYAVMGDQASDTQNRQDLDDTASYTNFAEIATGDVTTDPTLRSRVLNITQHGLKALIDLGKVLWCPGTDNTYQHLCPDYLQRWSQWQQTNSSVINSTNVLAFGVLDEPFSRDAMGDYDTAANLVKSTYPWSKIYMIEAGVTIRQSGGAFDRYIGVLPSVDWVGVDEYAIHPATSSGYQSALTKLKQKFPGKKIVYVLDGYWDASHAAAFGNIDAMGSIADEWYSVARSDPNAAMIAVFLWGSGPNNSQGFPCTVLKRHIAIGRAVTGKARPRTSLPIGYLDGIDSNGCASGWACDPDGAICETVQVSFNPAGLSSVSGTADQGSESAVNSLCKTGRNHRFFQCLPAATIGHQVTVTANDLDSGVSSIPAYSCTDRPACVWYRNVYPPKGFLDGINSSGFATGWTCDPDAPSVSIQVQFLANGSSAGVFRADAGNEPAVTSQCGGGTAHRFGVQLPAWTKGASILAYGLDTMSGSSNLPGWLCAQNPACVW